MGTLLDAYALIAFLAAETAGPEVRRLLERRDCAMTTVSLTEAADRVTRRGVMRRGELEQVVQALPLSIVPFAEPHAWRAAELRARYYHRRDRAISLADCCLVAVATAADRVVTADPSVLHMAEAEGVPTVALPRP